MKKIFSLVLLVFAVTQIKAQQQFIKAVNYRGAFAPAPTPMWTDSWTNWDPQNTVYAAPTKIISTPITSNTTWYADTVYEIQGLIYVKNNAILNIQAGTLIRGDANTANSSLVVTKGAKVYAVGTASQPIVFTSNKAAGSRAPGDWGGVILLGKASYNGAGGIANIEGIAPTADTEFGGGASPDDNDNSGVLKYVRIEFGGYVFQPNKEINGLTFGAIGRGTTIDYVQCSFINDDAFEWFGGTVNCSHLVSYRGVDDEFDTDNGFSGSVQFCLGVRDPQIGDPTYNVSGGSVSEGFESDNDATGSSNTPQTSAIFSNITLVGPLRGDASVANQAAIHPAFRRSARLRRNTALKIFNSILLDYPRGLHIDGTAAEANATNGILKFKNNIVAGNAAGKVTEINTGSTFNIVSFFASNNNDSLVSTSGILTNPYNFTAPDYRPAAGSPALSNTNFSDASIAAVKVVETNPFIQPVNYRGAFAPCPANMWTDSWTNWDPQNTAYPTATKIITTPITSNTTWYADTVYELQGLIYVKNNATLTIQPGTVIRGDANTANSSLVVTKGAKVYAVGTASQPIVFTSNKAVGSRAPGDWGGVILLGKAHYNGAGGIANIEGIAPTADTEFGGGASPDDNDNSGILKYVRIEFGGYVFQPNKEINGLTFGAVGRGTIIDYVQCSFINDDAFEWFGGSVNCSHLVSYRGVDDEFDTDNGFNGIVQFCLGVRDPQIGDPTYNVSGGSVSEGFESDNDATGSTNTPKTAAVFSNVTFVGPLRGDASAGNQAAIHPAFRRSARLRRNTELKVFNCIMLDYPRGIHIDGTAAENNATANNLRFSYNLVAGNASGKVTEINTGSTFDIVSWFASRRNDSLVATTGILANPYNFTSPDYRPCAGSPGLFNYNFNDTSFNGLLSACEVSAPSAISGSTNVCSVLGTNSTITYSVTAVPNVNYTWTVPAGAVIVSGQGTNTIYVKFNSYTSGAVSVIATASCGAVSTATSLALTKTAPGVPAAINGPTNACLYIGGGNATYSVAPVSGANRYRWTVPAGATIASANSDSSTIAVTYTNAFTSGSVTVKSVSGCGISAAKSLVILKKTSPLPGTISGPADVCTFLGGATYKINKLADASSYTWTLPAECSFVSAPAAGDTSISVTFTNNFTSGTIAVTSTNGCGTSAAKTLLVKKALPATPGPITGPTDVCLTMGSSVYSIKQVPLATSYIWTLPAGASFVNTPAAGDTSIEVSFDATAYPLGFNSGTISVQSQRVCGTSLTARTLLVKRKLPAAPGVITGRVDICDSIGQGPAGNLLYSIKSVPTATSYAWTVPAGGTIVSQPTDTTVVVNFASYSSGSIGVISQRVCGNSTTTRTLALKKTLPTAPASITGPLNVCDYITSGNVAYYTAAVSPLATSYVWTAPAGATIVSGQGTITAGFVFDNTFGSLGSISVKAARACGQSGPKTLSVGKLPVKPVGITAGGNSCAGFSQTFTVTPAAPDYATKYRWTKPTTVGCVITAANGPDSTTVTIFFPASFVSGTVKVKSVNGCGTSADFSLAVSNVCPPVVARTNGRTITVAAEAQLFPNPNSGSFTLTAQADGISDAAQIQIVNAYGQVVAQYTTRVVKGNLQYRINNSDLQNGVYTVRYTIGTETRSIKMVVQK